MRAKYLRLGALSALMISATSGAVVSFVSPSVTGSCTTTPHKRTSTTARKPSSTSTDSSESSPADKPASTTKSSLPRGHAVERFYRLPFDEVVAQAQRSGKLDGSVKFYLAGMHFAGKLETVDNYVYALDSQAGNSTTDDEKIRCAAALEGALVKLQDQAKAAHADAVVDIVTTTSKGEKEARTDALINTLLGQGKTHTYECHFSYSSFDVDLHGRLAKVQ